MDEQLTSAIATTQAELGGLFQKPKLTEKLLSKPPFRYLHDIVSAVTLTTGFAAGLYSEEELDSGSIKDKGSKIAYLEKIIDLVGICCGTRIDIRPSKVVAGLEPVCTNALLAALGRCAKSSKLDFDEAVRRALAEEAPGARSPPFRPSTGIGTDDSKDLDSGGDKGRESAVRDDRSGGKAEAKLEAKGERDDGSSGTKGLVTRNTRNLSAGAAEGAAEGGSTRENTRGGSVGGEPKRGGGGGGGAPGGTEAEEKASAKHEMEEMGAAAKVMGVPQSRRLSSRAGDLGTDASGMGGRDLTDHIEACTGEITVTRQMLEPIISRPKLTDKLLNMPPFRFLHDIVSEVTRQTGFGKGLYTGDELDSSMVKAKPAKIAYLDKLILLVGTSLNTLVDARPAKIVAGLEAENTNRLLQLLALAATERPDSTREVEVVLSAGAASERRRSSKGAMGMGERGSVAEDDPSMPVSSTRQNEGQGQQRQRVPPSVSELSGLLAGGDANSTAPSGSLAAGPVKPGTASGRRASEEKSGGADHGTGMKAPSQETAAEAISVGNSVVGDAEAKRSMRPRTARRRPPAVKDNTKEFTYSTRTTGGDAESKAPPKVASIMMDGDGDGDDKASEEDEADPVERGSRVSPGTGRGAKGDGGAHTAMVADILKEKEDAAASRAKEAEADAKKPGESQSGGGGIRMGRLRGPGSSLSKSSGSGGIGFGDNDVAKLKEAIQALCQSTNPLGKCMDFVHEDLSLMSQEMERWRALHKVKAEALEAERTVTEDFLRPLRLQLRDLDDQLKESSIKIKRVKANISGNEEKIRGLLKMVVTS